MTVLNVPLPWTLHLRRDGSQYINCGDPRTGAHAAFDISDWHEIGVLIAAAPPMAEALNSLVNAIMQGDDTGAFQIAKNAGLAALARAGIASPHAAPEHTGWAG